MLLFQNVMMSQGGRHCSIGAVWLLTDMQASTAQEPQRVRQHPFATCMCSIRLTRQSKSQSPKIDWSGITPGVEEPSDRNWSLKPHILIVNIFANATNVPVNVFANATNERWRIQKKRFKHTNTNMHRIEDWWGTSFVGRPPKHRVCYVSCFA